jgi:hypothetical protein
MYLEVFYNKLLFVGAGFFPEDTFNLLKLHQYYKPGK